MGTEVQIRPNNKKKRRLSTCVGCGSQIQDQYILRVAPDLEWHASCLKCADCDQFLDETCTCFVRDGKTYCKRDYVRLFGTKCAKCGQGFSKNDFVMRACAKVYHIDCFRCVACSRQLIPGDEFALRDDGLFCKADHDVVDKLSAPSDDSKSTLDDSKDSIRLSINNNNNDDDKKNKTMQHIVGHLEPLQNNNSLNSQTTIIKTSKSGGRSGGRSHKSDQKTTRVRTVLNEKQLHTLRTCYGANPRPDALMKEQLTEMTGLSSRVIRVWFQNKRCKDKKRNILLKQMAQQQQDKVDQVNTDWPCPRCLGAVFVRLSPVSGRCGCTTVPSVRELWLYDCPRRQGAVVLRLSPPSGRCGCTAVPPHSAAIVRRIQWPDIISPLLASLAFLPSFPRSNPSDDKNLIQEMPHVQNDDVQRGTTANRGRPR
ncbi:Insulin gene enhancer protein ISL-1 [Lamellibrachia satsuma]|nr:Insulin gene enhancer protein ISL-1 [Lamellibrachia satsuma]